MGRGDTGKKEGSLNLTFNYIVLDTETTGLSPSEDEILQLSIIDQTGSVPFDEYFKPKADSWDDAMAVNGITPDMVKDKMPISNHKDQIEAILSGAELIVGYNVGFDLSMLEGEGIDLPDIPVYDVMREFAPIYGEYNEYYGSYRWQSLTTAAGYYDYDWSSHEDQAHNSLADCFATQFVFEKMQEYSKNDL